MDAIGNSLLVDELYDRESLKVLAESHSATSIANSLASEVLKKSDSIIDSLFNEISFDICVNDNETSKIKDSEWVEKFEYEIDRALVSWEEAESEFLKKKKLWEDNVSEQYSEELENWLKAYDEFSEKKDLWKKSLSDRIEKARKEINSLGQNYLYEISMELMKYKDVLDGQNVSAMENLTLMEETYVQVRNLLKTYSDNTNSWISVWGKKYLKVFDYIKKNNPDVENNVFVEIIKKGSVDLNDVDEKFLKNITSEINRFVSFSNGYFESKALEKGDGFTNFDEILGSKNEFLGFLNGAVENKKTEAYLRNEMISFLKKSLDDYITSTDVQVNQAEFHLKEIEQEYEIAKAVYEYAINTTNLTENAFNSELNRQQAEQKLNIALEKHRKRYEENEVNYKERIDSLKKELENCNGNFSYTSKIINELALLQSEYEKEIEKLNEENLEIENYRLNVRKANAIIDYGNSIYLTAKDAESKMIELSKSVEESRRELKALKENYGSSNNNLSVNVLEKLNQLYKAEKNFIDSESFFENACKTVEEYEGKIFKAEIDVLEKRLVLVSKLNVPEFTDKKYNLVSIVENEYGKYEVKLNLKKEELEIDHIAFNDFFINECSIKENKFKEDEYYTSAEMDLLDWSEKMFRDLDYLQDVSLASLFYLNEYGLLDDEEGLNINPYTTKGNIYVLSNVDPDDRMDTVMRYLQYRMDAIDLALKRVKSHEGWEVDVARCILYRNSNSLIGARISALENYGINSYAYSILSKKYKSIRDNHTFGKKLFGSLFRDSKGKLAEACRKKMNSLKAGVDSNEKDLKTRMTEMYSEYLESKDRELQANIKLNELLYGKAFSEGNDFCAADFMKSLEFWEENDLKISDDDVEKINGCISENFSGKNSLEILYQIASLSKLERNEIFSEVQTLFNSDDKGIHELVDLYGKISSELNSKLDLNLYSENLYICFMDSLDDVYQYVLHKKADSSYENYACRLSETFSAYEKNLEDKYEDICRIAENSESQWKLSEEKLNYEFNTWLKDFEDKYGSKNEELNYMYTSFLENRQEYISRQYLEQTFEAFGVDDSEKTIECYSENYLYDQANSRIQDVLDSISSIEFSKSFENINCGYNSSACITEVLRKNILEEQKVAAAKKAAYQAFDLIEGKKKEGLDKIAYLNEAQREWEIELVRNKGYVVAGDSITRKVTDGCTLFSNLYKKQSVHFYRDYVPENFDFSINFAAVNNLCDEAIKDMLAKVCNEYYKWEEAVFGTENTDGKFQEYLGDIPEIKSNVDVNKDKKNSSFTYGLKGEVTLILMDLQWNDLEELVSYEDFNKSLWDMKIADATWAPSLRTASTIATAVAAAIVSCGTLAAGASAYTAAALSSAITMANEINFATLDLASGYKSPYEVGKSLASAAVSSGVGIATAGIMDKISNLESAVSRVGYSALYQSGKTAFNTTTSSLIMNDFNLHDFKDSMMTKANYAKTLASLIYGSVSSGLNELNIGFNNSNVTGFSNRDISDIRIFDSFMGEAASSIFEFAYTGKTILNLASVKGVGLLELEIGNDGIQAQIGMNGHNVGFDTILSATGGLMNIVENNHINDYAGGDSMLASALRMQYGFGNENAKIQLREILDGNIEIIFDDGLNGRNLAKSVLLDGHKSILLGSDEYGDYKKLGIVLQHEAERNGYDDGLNGQLMETISSVVSHSDMIKTMGRDALYADEVKKFISSDENIIKDLSALDALKTNGNLMEYVNYVYGNYDFTEDFWRITWNGQLINDKQGYLKDENGYYVNQDGSHTKERTSQTLGASGIESGLLNIIANSTDRDYSSFSDEDILAAQQLMMDSGMTPSNPNSNFKDYNWDSNLKGKKLNMYEFMIAAGKKVNDEIFNLRYNNIADLVLAQRYGVDLGYTKDASDFAIPVELLGKFWSLVNSHGKEKKNGQELLDKYKFEIKNSDGSVTSLYKLTKDNPHLGKLLGQHDFGEKYNSINDSFLNEVIDSDGCNFMATIAIPQLLTGNILDKEGVIDIWEESTATLIMFDEGFKNLVTEDEAIVNDRNKLVKLAMDKLNLDSFYTTYSPLRKNDVYVNNRIGFYKKDANGKLYPYHFTVGDINGNVIYNPGFGLTDIIKMDKIFVGEKK